MIERYAYLGGMDGVSCVAGAERTGIEATGTMPHSLIICFGEDRQKEAWKAFDEVIAPEVPRICLCDTYYDEKKEAVMAAEALGESCSPVVSGGINEEDVIELEMLWQGWEQALQNRKGRGTLCKAREARREEAGV